MSDAIRNPEPMPPAARQASAADQLAAAIAGQVQALLPTMNDEQLVAAARELRKRDLARVTRDAGLAFAGEYASGAMFFNLAEFCSTFDRRFRPPGSATAVTDAM